MFKLSKSVKRGISAIVVVGAVLAVLFAPSYPVAAYASPAPVNLGLAGNFAILSKSGISNAGATTVVEDIGVSPISYSAITGFALTPAVPNGSNTYATSALVTGKVYASDYSTPTPAYMSTSVSNMQTAYTDAAGRTSPDATGLGAGEIGGMTLAPGLYKWSTGVTISTSANLSGGANDVWIFQIAGTLTVSNGVSVNMTGGALPENVFWQVAGQTTLGTTSVFNGNILCLTAIVVNNGATLNGRALAQTAVTLGTSGAIVKPTSTPVPFSPPPTVGGEAYPINKVYVLAPWLILALAIVIGGSVLVLRRRTSR